MKQLYARWTSLLLQQKRQRTDFIRKATRDAIRNVEYQQISQAYMREPDSADEADDWSNADEWKA